MLFLTKLLKLTVPTEGLPAVLAGLTFLTFLTFLQSWVRARPELGRRLHINVINLLKVLNSVLLLNSVLSAG